MLVVFTSPNILSVASGDRKYFSSTESSKMSLSEVVLLIPCGKLNATIFIFGLHNSLSLSFSMVLAILVTASRISSGVF